MVVAESLRAAEEREGLPLRPQAPSGKIFQKALDMSGLLRSPLTVTNIIRCKAEAPYPQAALDQCKQYLDAAVEERRPRFILALGDTPLNELSLTKGPISELRGYVLASRYSIPMIATYHPAHLARGAMHLYGVFMHDLRRAESYARNGVPRPMETNYGLVPTDSMVARYLSRLRSSPLLPIAYDIETEGILGLKEPEALSKKRIIQIQFSSEAGTALVLPWPHEGALEILKTPNPKIGWNSRLFDDIVLKANGVQIGGESFDGMAMFSHLQPGFASGKDANDSEDKGVPARLLNLQSAISFYYPYEPLWKETMRAALHGGAVSMDDVRYGGARDADLTLRVGLKLIASLKKQGLWDGFYRYKHRLGIVLSEMSERGLPIDRNEQRKLRQRIEWQELILERDLQELIPEELKPIHTYKGFPANLREAVKAAGLWVKCCKPVEYPELAASLGYSIRSIGIGQQLYKTLPFNSGSSPQILTYLQHRIDTVGTPWYIPLHIDTKKPTTNKAGMEGLIAATDDPALKQIEKCKKIAKLQDYCQGKWEPGPDGRVHAEFRVGSTATGQTTATNPPIQTYPKHYSKDDEWLVPTMKRVKAIIKASAGHIMVETDMRGFHARMQGWLAEDAAYYRLANIDCHSFSTAHYVGVPDKDTMLQLDDTALTARLNEIKTQYEYERNYKLKRISFLNQYGGGAEKAATILRLPRLEVEQILSLIKNLFEKTFKDLPKAIENSLRRNPKLVTPFGFVRYIWDQDVNQAVAFWVASPAHCVIQDAVIRLHDRGALQRFNAVNLMHDALWWCPREEDADECIAVAHEEFERASDVLVNSLGAFQCNADASKGYDMAGMRGA